MIKSILAALSAIAFVGSLALAQEGAAPTAPANDKPAATTPVKKSAKKGKKKTKKTSSASTKSQGSKS